MRQIVAALALLGGGCDRGLDAGFGVALTVLADGTLDAAALARIRRLEITSGGDESETVGYDFPRAAFVQREERVVFRPWATSRAIQLGVTVLDADGVPVGAGASGPLALDPGATTPATVFLSAGAPAFDLAVPQDAGPFPDGGAPDGPTGPAGPFVFTAQRGFHALTRIDHLAAGDLDGDGRLDVVALSVQLAVLRGRGDGSFDPIAPITVGTSPVDLTVADFNADGKADVAVLLNEGKVAVLLSQGPTLAAPVFYPIAVEPLAMTSGDLNGDGKPDLVLANGGKVSVLLNNGNGTFATAVAYSTGTQPPLAVAIGELSGDGKADIVAALFDGSVQLLVNAGSGTFGAPSPILIGVYNIKTLATADLDRDGKTDVLVGRDPAGEVDVLINQGGNAFMFAAPNPIAAGVGAVLPLDLDGDGKIDVAVPSPLGLSQLTNAGAGTFGVPSSIPVPSTSSAAAGDFDGDGHLDVALGNKDSGDVILLRNDGHGNFPGPAQRYLVPLGAGGAAADLDGDGKPDLVADSTTNPNVVVFVNDGRGGFATQRAFPLPNASTALTLGDLDGNGKLDVVIADPRANSVDVLLNDGTGQLGAVLTRLMPVLPYSLVTGDFDGDHTVDVTVVGFALGGTGQDVAVLPNPSGNGALTTPLLSSSGATARGIVSGDFNGDGRLDLALTHQPSTTGARLSVLLGQGSNSFAAPVSYSAGADPQELAAADLDGDGRLDLIVSDLAGGQVAVLRNQGSGVFGPPTSYPTAASPYGLAVADFDRDGALNLAVAQIRSAEVVLLRGHGDGTFEAGPIYAGYTSSLAHLAAADFDGDGRIDLALFGADALVILRNQSP